MMGVGGKGALLLVGGVTSLVDEVVVSGESDMAMLEISLAPESDRACRDVDSKFGEAAGVETEEDDPGPEAKLTPPDRLAAAAAAAASCSSLFFLSLSSRRRLTHSIPLPSSASPRKPLPELGSVAAVLALAPEAALDTLPRLVLALPKPHSTNSGSSCCRSCFSRSAASDARREPYTLPFSIFTGWGEDDKVAVALLADDGSRDELRRCESTFEDEELDKDADKVFRLSCSLDHLKGDLGKVNIGVQLIIGTPSTLTTP
jgi:hypothetical protein